MTYLQAAMANKLLITSELGFTGVRGRGVGVGASIDVVASFSNKLKVAPVSIIFVVWKIWKIK